MLHKVSAMGYHERDMQQTPSPRLSPNCIPSVLHTRSVASTSQADTERQKNAQLGSFPLRNGKCGDEETGDGALRG